MRTRPSPLVVGLVVVVGLVLSACASGSRGSTPASASVAPTTTVAETVATAVEPTAKVKVAMRPAGRRVDGSLRTADGRVRTYHVYVPGSLPQGKPVPLLVALHGGLGHGTQFETNSGFDGLAEANRFLVVYPDGTPLPAIPAGRVWNAGGCCGSAAEDRDDVDDVAFVSKLIDTLGARYRVDRARVFATGHSNGAMMSYRLACELSSKVVAIGVQSGALFQTGCHPSKPVSVLAIHGTADENVPLAGGVGTRGVSGVSFPPPPDGPKAFARLDRCASPPTTSTDRANRDVRTTAWSGCTKGTAVRFVTVTGANHAWMGHPSASAASAALVGQPYQRFDSSLAIWTFLAAVPRR